MFCLSSKIENHLFTEPLIPYESNLSSNLLWLITSYALERSCLTGYQSIWIYTDAEEGLTR